MILDPRVTGEDSFPIQMTLFDCIDTINGQNYHMTLHFGANRSILVKKTTANLGFACNFSLHLYIRYHTNFALPLTTKFY